MFSDANIRGDRIAERQIPSYLWETWKFQLKRKGYDWQQFQSEVSSASWMMQAWGTNDADWEEVLEKLETALDAEIEGA